MINDPTTGFIGDNLVYTRTFSANRFISWAQFVSTQNSLEYNWDFLEIGRLGLTPTFNVTGARPAGESYVLPGGFNNFQKRPAVFRLLTDSTNASPGFGFSGVWLLCSGSNGYFSGGELVQGRRASGVLLGTNDSVLFEWELNHPLFLSGAQQRRNLILWNPAELASGVVDTSIDFDVYAKCGAVPTKTSYDFVSNSGDSSEFLSVPESACARNQKLYVVVYSYKGTGQFELRASYSNNTQDRILGGSIQHTDNGVNLTENTRMLIGARAIFAQTMGNFLPRGVCTVESGMTNYCGTPLTFTRRWDCTRSAATGGFVGLCTDFPGNTLIMAHEFGHAQWSLPDEYLENGANPPVSISGCGHSVMAGYGPGPQPFQFCPSLSHSFDRLTGPAVTPTSAWSLISATADIVGPPPGASPDPVDLRNHDFNGYMTQSVYVW